MVLTALMLFVTRVAGVEPFAQLQIPALVFQAGQVASVIYHYVYKNVYMVCVQLQTFANVMSAGLMLIVQHLSVTRPVAMGRIVQHLTLVLVRVSGQVLIV